MLMMDTTTATFQQDVLVASSEQPIVLDLWAPWCAPCRMLGPILEKLEKEAGGAWKLVKLDTDKSPEVAQALQVQGIPDVRLVVNGGIKSAFTGVKPEAEIKAWLDEHIGPALPPGGDLLAAAKKARLEGDEGMALQLLQQALQTNPTPETTLSLAELVLVADPEAATKLLGELSEEEQGDRGPAITTLLQLQEKTEKADGSEGWKLYTQGIQAFWGGQPTEAADLWLQTVSRFRKVDDDGARKAMLALFLWLGAEHELTLGYRSKLASAMY